MPNVLLVEDEALIALDIAEALGAAGYYVVGPASTVGEALALLQDNACHAAVLDVHLGRETSAPLAARLRDLAIPIVAMTGYAPDQLPAEFRDAVKLSKPVDVEILARRLLELVSKP